jgi:hypothetical protein
LTLAFTGPVEAAKGSKHNKAETSACSKPPDLVSKGTLSKEDQEKAKNVRMVGTVAVTINQDGKVTDVRVVRAPSKDSAELLSHLVSTFKFKPRPGCGDFKTQMNFGLE